MAPLALQAAAPPNRGPQSIAEFIRRTNAEPGGFRGLREKDLRAEIEAAKNKQDEADVEMEDIDDVDDSSATARELAAAREEILRNIATAHWNASTMLDILSLLISKEMPNQVTATLRPELRNMVGIGTLGTTALADPTSLTRSRIPENKLTAIGMRLQSVSEACEFLDSAAERLEKEIGLETTYWNEVMAASERGWSVFRQPDDPTTMGVKFGFSSAAPEFKANSIAPMRRNEDGTVRLEHGRMTGVPKRLQVVITQAGNTIGQSRLSPPLQDEVKEARDTVFAQELWYELNREARTLLAHGVRLLKDTVQYTDETDRTISFQLATLEDGNPPFTPLPEDGEAERISDMLHLLLIHAHRQNEAKRSEQSALGANRSSTPVLPLLLPVITSHTHELVVQKTVNLLTDICHMLNDAGLNPPPFFTFAEQLPPILSTEALAATLQNPPASEIDLAITPFARLRIIARPHGSITRFTVYLLPPSSPDQQQTQPLKANPLWRYYPPGPVSHTSDSDPNRPPPTATPPALYDSTDKLFQYLSAAVPHALAPYFQAAIPRDPSVSGSIWSLDVFGTSIMDGSSVNGVHFRLAEPGKSPSEWEMPSLGEEEVVRTKRTWEELQLSVEVDVLGGRPDEQRVWAWGAAAAGEGTMEEAVRFAMANRLQAREL